MVRTLRKSSMRRNQNIDDSSKAGRGSFAPYVNSYVPKASESASVSNFYKRFEKERKG